MDAHDNADGINFALEVVLSIDTTLARLDEVIQDPRQISSAHLLQRAILEEARRRWGEHLCQLMEDAPDTWSQVTEPAPFV